MILPKWLLSILLLCCWPSAVLAQDEGSVVSEAAVEDDGQSDPIDATPPIEVPEVSNTGADSQVFIPSEEISEDAPVDFPVDI